MKQEGTKKCGLEINPTKIFLSIIFFGLAIFSVCFVGEWTSYGFKRFEDFRSYFFYAYVTLSCYLFFGFPIYVILEGIDYWKKKKNPKRNLLNLEKKPLLSNQVKKVEKETEELKELKKNKENAEKKKENEISIEKMVKVAIFITIMDFCSIYFDSIALSFIPPSMFQVIGNTRGFIIFGISIICLVKKVFHHIFVKFFTLMIMITGLLLILIAKEPFSTSVTVDYLFLLGCLFSVIGISTDSFYDVIYSKAFGDTDLSPKQFFLFISMIGLICFSFFWIPLMVLQEFHIEPKFVPSVDIVIWMLVNGIGYFIYVILANFLLSFFSPVYVCVIVSIGEVLSLIIFDSLVSGFQFSFLLIIGIILIVFSGTLINVLEALPQKFDFIYNTVVRVQKKKRERIQVNNDSHDGTFSDSFVVS